MRIEDKQLLLDVLNRLNDGGDDVAKAIRHMKYELGFADTDTYSVSVEDLEDYYDQTDLREKLGKGDNEDYTIDDCQRVADAIADFACEEFSTNLENAIMYEM